MRHTGVEEVSVRYSTTINTDVDTVRRHRPYMPGLLIFVFFSLVDGKCKTKCLTVDAPKPNIRRHNKQAVVHSIIDSIVTIICQNV